MSETPSREFKGSFNPSLLHGGKVMYDQYVPFEVLSENDQNPDIEQIRFTIISRENNAETLEFVKIELSTDQNVFFQYESEITPEAFQQIKEDQELSIDFDSLPDTIIEMINSKHYRFIFKQDGNNYILTFQQILKYGTVEIFSLYFRPTPSHILYEQIQYRYDEIQSRIKKGKAEIANLYAILDVKTPSPKRSPRPIKSP